MTDSLSGPGDISGPGVLGMGPEDYRVLGLALASYATGTAAGPREEDTRGQAAGLLDDLIRWGYVPADLTTSTDDTKDTL